VGRSLDSLTEWVHWRAGQPGGREAIILIRGPVIQIQSIQIAAAASQADRANERAAVAANH